MKANGSHNKLDQDIGPIAKMEMIIWNKKWETIFLKLDIGPTVSAAGNRNTLNWKTDVKIYDLCPTAGSHKPAKTST